MNSKLLKLKKILLEANTPSREKQIAKALRVAFASYGENSLEEVEGMTVKEAYKLIGWD